MNSAERTDAEALSPRPVATRNRHPVFLDLRKIAMPVGALTSIGHRISGVVLAVTTPVAIFLFARSLKSEFEFERVMAVAAHPAFKLAAVIAIWALAHHLLGGVRHLFSDFEVGSRLRSARKSAWFVNVAAAGVALLAVAVMW